MSYELRDKYIDHLFELDASAYASFTKGDLIARATNGLEGLEEAYQTIENMFIIRQFN